MTTTDRKSDITSVRLDKNTRALLDELIRREERSQSHIIRRALRVYAGIEQQKEEGS